jgi:hypothetical protein
VRQYGSVVLRLRPYVRARATFTFGDSLDQASTLSAEPPFAPAPLAQPRMVALNSEIDCLTAAKPADAVDSRYRYIEAQIHGGIRPIDVQEVVFTLGTSASAPILAALSRMGLPFNVVPGDEPT